jgi:hypothetical protein
MSHYKANVRDIEFNLFEVLDLERRWQQGNSAISTAKRSTRCSPKPRDWRKGHGSSVFR